MKGKRVANRYCIKVNPGYMQKNLQGFRGKGSAEFFRQHTSELWDPMFSALSVAEYGAVRRILMMFAREKMALKENMILVTEKELKMHGISMRILTRLGEKFSQLEISLLTDSGEIKSLSTN